MNLVFIHGRDQQGQDSSVLKQTWIDTFKEGLAKNNLALPDANIVFPYYGDLLDSLVDPEKYGKTIEGVLAKGNLPDSKLIFFNELLTEIAKESGITDDQIIAEFEGDIAQRGPLNSAAVLAIARAIDRHTPFGLATVEKFTYDVFIYLTLSNVQKQINEFIIKWMGNDPCVVVGHSLGSVVGYQVLRNSPNADVKKYVTVGSPLGVRAVQSKLVTPFTMPRCIKEGSWFNARDPRDIVSLFPLDSKYFNIDPNVVNYDSVNNTSDNRHNISGYLSDPEVAKNIYNALIS